MKLQSLNKMLLEILGFKWKKKFGIEEIKDFENLRFNIIFPKLYGLKIYIYIIYNFFNSFCFPCFGLFRCKDFNKTLL